MKLKLRIFCGEHISISAPVFSTQRKSQVNKIALRDKNVESRKMNNKTNKKKFFPPLRPIKTNRQTTKQNNNNNKRTMT